MYTNVGGKIGREKLIKNYYLLIGNNIDLGHLLLEILTLVRSEVSTILLPEHELLLGPRLLKKI